jgi:hypothetical protein
LVDYPGGPGQIRIDRHVEARRSPYDVAQHEVLHCIEADCSSGDRIAHRGGDLIGAEHLQLAGPSSLTNGNEEVAATVIKNPIQMELNWIDEDVYDLWLRRRTHNPNDRVDGLLTAGATTDGSLPLVSGHIKYVGSLVVRPDGDITLAMLLIE